MKNFSPKTILELTVKALAKQPAYLLVFGVCFVFLAYGGIATGIGLAKDNNVALVCGLVGFVAALVTTILAIRSVERNIPIEEANEVHRLREKVKQYEIASKDVGEKLTEYFIHKVGSASITYRMTDLDGHLKSEWKFDEVQIVRPGASLPVIFHEMWCGAPGASVTKYPELDDAPWDRELLLEPYDKSPNGFKCELLISGSLQYGESLSYGFTTEVAKGFLVTKDETEANSPPEFRKEFWGFSVAGLMDKLEIQVFFPPGYAIHCYAGVCYGVKVRSLSSMDAGELKRIRIDNSKTSARLTVEKPLVGFTYLIYWTPPAQIIVDALRTAT